MVYDYFKSPGPGGQHKNKTLSSVKATDTISGLSAIATESRSQATNKKVAYDRVVQLAQQSAKDVAHCTLNDERVEQIDQKHNWTWDYMRGRVLSPGGKVSLKLALSGRWTPRLDTTDADVVDSSAIQ